MAAIRGREFRRWSTPRNGQKTFIFAAANFRLISRFAMGRIRTSDFVCTVRRIFIQAAWLLAITIVLSACSKETEEKIACPDVEVLRGLGELVRFRPGPGRDATDVLIEAWVDRVGGECFLNGNELQVDLNVRIVMRRGPATKTDRAKVGYFVAITDLNRNVLSRQPFETNAAFSSRKTIIFEDVLDLVIPLQPGLLTDGFSIYVGLTLSEQELKFNRGKQK
jgi:hypothetical protein